MRFLLKNHFDNAITSLQTNRSRTALAIVGITIGVAGITAVVSLTSGSNKLLARQAANAREGVAIVRSGLKANSKLNLNEPQPLSANTLTKKDAEDIARIPQTTSAPLAVLHTRLTAGKTTISADHTALVGSTGPLRSIASLELRRESQFIDETDGIVLGNQLSIDLFGTEESLGSVVHVRGHPLTVVGVIKPLKQSANYLGVDFDNAAIVPLHVLASFTENTAQIQQIVINANDRQTLKTATDAAGKILADNHKGDTDYHLVTGDEIIAPNRQLVHTLSTVITIVSGIALLIGGIGIMSIMLVNVAERRREIAIRRAVGATRGNIINQFLIEAAIAGLSGGILGYMIGIAGAYVMSFYLPFEPILHWHVAAITIGIALSVGIFFGIHPALRAADRDPIESLRY